MTARHIRSGLAISAFPGLLVWLAACGGSDAIDLYKSRPNFLVGEPVRTDYDGMSAGLITGTTASLAALLAFKLPTVPTAAELRTLAIQSSYTALLDVSAEGGLGTYYGKLSAAANKGSEYVAVADDGSGMRNVTIVIDIPSSFDATRPCLVAVPASGSRPVYGEIATIGEWALNKGCAVALTDKGSGVGTHDLDRDLSFTTHGDLTAAGERKDLTFNANLLGDDLAKFRAANPNRIALKHAHGKQNPEKDWGQHTLQAIKVALYVLNQHLPAGNFVPASTLVIGSSISNGGAAVLRAAEQDTEGLLDAVVAGEPQVNLPEGAGLTVKRSGVTVPVSGRPLVDYVTYAALYQPCATRSAALSPTSAFVDASTAENRCSALAALGLVDGTTVAEQSAGALNKLHAYGWEADSDLLHDSHYGLEFTELVTTTFANAYARAAVTDSLCGYSVAGTDAAFNTPVVPAPEAFKAGWAAGGGLGFLAGAYNIVNDRSVGGPAYYQRSVSASTGKADFDIDGASCLRRLATGAAVGSTPISAAEQPLAGRVRAGLDEVRVSGNLRGKPAVIVHGRSDALLPVSHTSRPYVALNLKADADARLRYYEVADANHFDALVALYPRPLVPLHVYMLRALDAVYANLTAGTMLPASQVVRAKGRASAAATLTDANVPALATEPAAADRIVVSAGVIDVPN